MLLMLHLAFFNVVYIFCQIKITAWNQIFIYLKIESNKSPNIHSEVHKKYCTSKEMRRERLHLCRERDRKRASENIPV